MKLDHLEWPAFWEKAEKHYASMGFHRSGSSFPEKGIGDTVFEMRRGLWLITVAYHFGHVEQFVTHSLFPANDWYIPGDLKVAQYLRKLSPNDGLAESTDIENLLVTWRELRDFMRWIIWPPNSQKLQTYTFQKAKENLGLK